MSDEASGERRLLCAVLHLAMWDIEHGNQDDATNAMRFVADNGRVMRACLDAANLSHDRVLAKALELQESRRRV